METIATPVQNSPPDPPSAGLTTAEAQPRLGEVDRNEIVRGAATSPWTILLTQFGSPLIWLLRGASIGRRAPQARGAQPEGHA